MTPAVLAWSLGLVRARFRASAQAADDNDAEASSEVLQWCECYEAETLATLAARTARMETDGWDEIRWVVDFDPTDADVINFELLRDDPSLAIEAARVELAEAFAVAEGDVEHVTPRRAWDRWQQLELFGGINE